MWCPYRINVADVLVSLVAVDHSDCGAISCVLYRLLIYPPAHINKLPIRGLETYAIQNPLRFILSTSTIQNNAHVIR